MFLIVFWCHYQFFPVFYNFLSVFKIMTKKKTDQTDLSRPACLTRTALKIKTLPAVDQGGAPAKIGVPSGELT